MHDIPVRRFFRIVVGGEKIADAHTIHDIADAVRY